MTEENSFLHTGIEHSKESLVKALSLGMEFVTGSNTENPVVDHLAADAAWKSLYEAIPESGTSLEKVLEEFQGTILKHSINFGSPQYLGFSDNALSVAGQAAHILSGLLNQNMINSKTASPTATIVEIIVIQWMRKLLGYSHATGLDEFPNAGGIATNGGTSANILGMLLARESGLLSRERKELQDFRIFLPQDVGHYSIERAAFVLGLPPNCLVGVAIDREFRLDHLDLARKVRREVDQGNIPLAIVAYAGNSKTLSIDPFYSVAEVAQEHGVWLHVDACHGFSLAFSAQLLQLIEGISLADSIAIDPHKVLCLPYSLSYLLVKDPSDLSLFRNSGNVVLSEPYALGAYDPLKGSSAFNSLKLWFLVKHLGQHGLATLVEKRHETIHWFAEYLGRFDDIVLVSDPAIHSCTFYFCPNRTSQSVGPELVAAYNEVNALIYETLMVEGEFFIHSFSLYDAGNRVTSESKCKLQCLRVSLGNPGSDRGVLRSLVGRVRAIGHSVRK